MRTVTFSDPGVVKLLNEKFVCAWVNKKPAVKFKDGSRPFRPRPLAIPEGAGISNVTSVFAASDGTVLHAMPGMLQVVSFQRHLDFAFALHSKLYAKGVTPEQRAGIYLKAHSDGKLVCMVRGPERKVHDLMGAGITTVGRFSLEFFDKLERRIGVA